MEFKPTLTSLDPKTGKMAAVLLPQWYAPERCTECGEMVTETQEFPIFKPGFGFGKYKATVHFCKLVEDGKPCKVNGEVYLP